MGLALVLTIATPAGRLHTRFPRNRQVRSAPYLLRGILLFSQKTRVNVRHGPPDDFEAGRCSPHAGIRPDTGLGNAVEIVIERRHRDGRGRSTTFFPNRFRWRWRRGRQGDPREHTSRAKSYVGSRRKETGCEEASGERDDPAMLSFLLPITSVPASVTLPPSAA